VRKAAVDQMGRTRTDPKAVSKCGAPPVVCWMSAFGVYPGACPGRSANTGRRSGSVRGVILMTMRQSDGS
jgi:hypothetical protein